MQPILRLEHVTCRYPGENTPALRDCSLSIHRGEKIAVLGRNGAGKSTFFLLLNGVIRPEHGWIQFGGKEIRKEADLSILRRGTGLVFQDPDVQILAGNVEEEVAFGPANLGLSRDEIGRAVDKAIAALHLEEYRRRAPQYLSGGEKKRVTIADVLAIDPAVMLLDEPASSLDPAGGRNLEEHLENLYRSGMALLVATHDLDFAWRWAERILVFEAGTLAADGTPEEIFSDQPLLERCALEKPVLYQVGELLGIAPPRTIEQLRQLTGTKQI